jgi:hypothetical protein
MKGATTGFATATGSARPQNPRLAQVEAYWTALYRDGQPPQRAQIDPRGIEAALEHAFIAERITSGEARLRVGGAHLSDLMGMEVRGMPVSALFTPTARPDLARGLAALFDRPAICRMALRSPGALGQPALDARALLLPLRGEDGVVSRVLGCLVSDGRIGRTPRRFDLTELRLEPVNRTRSAPGMAERETAFDSPHPAAPHLRLVSSE